jgi:hypothetical protein
MTLPTSQLVDITVSLEGAPAGAEAFGIPAIYDTENALGGSNVTPIITSISSVADAEAAGYLRWSKVHRMARALFAQSPRPQIVKVIDAGGVVDATSLSAAEAADPVWRHLLITSRAESDILAASGWVQDTASGRRFLVAETHDAAARTSGVSIRSTLFGLSRTRSLLFVALPALGTWTLRVSEAFVAANAITLQINGQTIGPVPFNADSDTTLADIATAIAAALPAAFSAVSVPVAAAADNDRDITITALDPLIDFVLQSYGVAGGASQGTGAIVATTATRAPRDAAAVGNVVPRGAGRATYFGKTLAGCTPDEFTSAEVALIKAQGGNVYVRIAGKSMIYNGTVSAEIDVGQPLFADLVDGVDVFESDLQTEIVSALTSGDKLPFDSDGIAAIVSAINGVAQRHVSRGFLLPYSFAEAFTVPRIEDIAAGDKTARVLNGLGASFEASGAIQKIGSLTVRVKA